MLFLFIKNVCNRKKMAKKEAEAKDDDNSQRKNGWITRKIDRFNDLPVEVWSFCKYNR